MTQSIKSTREKGSEAEDIASKFIIEKGYKIKKKNFHFGRYGEIDIIAMYKDLIVFIEVKSRTNNSYGDPLESLTIPKQMNIKRVAEGFLYVNKIEDVQCRFDVITINTVNGKQEINHYENAF